MTENEFNDIVAAVIDALKTNGKTIMQLTEVTSITDSDYFEINGGRRIAYEHLYDNLISETEDIIDDFETDVNTALDGKLDYYNANWAAPESSAQYTEANFNALSAAITAGKQLFYKHNIAIGSVHANMISLTVAFYNKYRQAEIWLNNGSVTVDWDDYVEFADDADLTTVAGRVTTLEGQVSDLSGLTTDITSLGNRMTAAEGSITSITGSTGALYVGYHNTNDSDYSELYTVSAALDLLIYKTKEVYCTMDEYNEMADAGTLDPNTKYFIYED